MLLAPGCASMDMFANYADRGDAFAAAVQRRRATTDHTTDREGTRGPMATASPERGRRRRQPRHRPRCRTGVPQLVRRLRDALDRPLTSYYLLLGASALLLTIGLIMVFSASSVYVVRERRRDSYAVGQGS